MLHPVRSIVGALLLHLGSTTFLYQDGKVFGCSSILYKSVFGPYTVYTVPVILGMVMSSLIAQRFAPPSYLPNYELTYYISEWKYFAAGLLAGIGTKYASGCTSGHMLCGIPRLSLRSLVATICFTLTAVLTAYASDDVPVCPTCFDIEFESTDTILHLVELFAAHLVILLILKYGLPSSKLNAFLSSLFSGFTFGMGLILGGMAEPANVLGFLAWTDKARFNPSLLFIVAAGMFPNYLVMVINQWFTTPPKNPVVGTPTGYDLPTGNHITLRLILGSMAFGVGWGLVGICPGPDILTCIFNPSIGLAWIVSFLTAYRLSPW